MNVLLYYIYAEWTISEEAEREGCFVSHDEAGRVFYLQMTFEKRIFSMLCVVHGVAEWMRSKGG